MTTINKISDDTLEIVTERKRAVHRDDLAKDLVKAEEDVVRLKVWIAELDKE